MTVIAWDGQVLAADSRLTCNGNLTSDNYNKIHILKNVQYLGDKLLVIGVSGTASDVLKLVEHLEDKEYLTKTLSHDIHAILIGEKYMYELYMNDVHMIRYNKRIKLGIGSGGDFAQSAMALGLNAKEAVKHAINMNVYCGGKIRIWEDK